MSGEWRLRLDAEDRGLRDGWPVAPLATEDRIMLPNTTDRAGFGFALDTNTMLHAGPFPVTTRFPGVKEPTRADEHGYLVRRHLYVGPAWYERDIEIPAAWQNRHIIMRLERAMWKTEVWVDGQPQGACDSLVAEHRYDLGSLSSGKHRFTVRVDNRLIHNLSTITHAYGPETQTRWNGLVGTMELEAHDTVAVRSVQVFPNAHRTSAQLRVTVANLSPNTVNGRLVGRLFQETSGQCLVESNFSLPFVTGISTQEVILALPVPADSWDEFHPVRYRAQVVIETPLPSRDEQSVMFGFRQVERRGQELFINGRRVFLRGTLDCAVYPQTGHPPMTVTEWERVLSVIKEYGFNHVRFHTWCPPEAAFEAADRLGLYLQAEAPAWVDDWGVKTITRPPAIGRDPAITDYLRAEMRRIVEAYGNHPSFVLFAIGNEFGSSQTDWSRVNAMVEEIKSLDPRRLYSGCAARKNLAADDFWVTHHTGASTRGVGPAHTDWDFTPAADKSPVPLIAHETGQRPVFPDYDALLPKFRGPLLPLNLERYRRSLADSGLAGQMKDFARASARFQLVQYKAEHEAMLRTRGYTGYQLLMLNDFTGQSEALVGILDPFWETKGIVQVEEVRAWNAPTVLLARFPKYVWTTEENFHARLEVAHYGERPLGGQTIHWSLKTRSGKVVAQGESTPTQVMTGRITELGEIGVPLNSLRDPVAMILSVRLGHAENHWNLWAYPATGSEEAPPGVLATKTLDEAAQRALAAGGKVVLLAHGIQSDRAAKTGFESVYWSAGWWGNQFSSLGILCDPMHPALADFPNDGHSDWQWRDLCAQATTFDLTGLPEQLRPIVQPVPDFHFNTRLAHVVEFKLGKGALLVCGYDLTSNLPQRPAARQFRRSLLRYVGSEAFQPKIQLPISPF